MTANHKPGKSGRHPSNRHGRRESPLSDGPVTIFGLHAVAAALDNSARRIARLAVTENAAQNLAPSITRRNIKPDIVSAKDLTRLIGSDAVHQGAVLMTSHLPEATLDTVAPTAEMPVPRLVILDKVTDPHNVGAILRSAAVFNVAGLVMTRRHSAPLEGVTAKAASGGLEHVPVILVNNLARAMRDIAKHGYHIIGLDGDGPEPLTTARAAGATALVLGAEGAGLRRLTRETCDEICHLPTTGPLRSLNVSNAAAVALSIIAIPLL